MATELSSEVIVNAMQKYDGDRNQAAADLGINLPELGRLINTREDLRHLSLVAKPFHTSVTHLPPELAEMAVAHQAWQAQQAGPLVQMVRGTAAAHALQLKAVLDKFYAILIDPAHALEGVPADAVQHVMKGTVDGYMQGSDILRKMAFDATKAQQLAPKKHGSSSRKATWKRKATMLVEGRGAITMES